MLGWLKRAWNFDTIIWTLAAKGWLAWALWTWRHAYDWYEYPAAALFFTIAAALYALAWLFVPPKSSEVNQ